MQEGFNKSDIEILIATMNRNSLDFLEPMFPSHFSDYNILIINQITDNNILVSDYPSVRIINSLEKGLSKSRNLALKDANGKLCVITDDDVVFKSGFEEKILKAFNENQDAGMISFRAEKPNGSLFKKYPQKRIINPTNLQLLSIMSVEIVLNKTVIKDKVHFDERFGLGAKFRMGEEGVFIFAVKRKKLKIIIEPEVLVQHSEDHTNVKLSMPDKYYIQGAFLSEIFKKAYRKWLLLKIFFDLKQGKIKFNQINTAIRAASDGKKDLNSIE